MKLSEKDYERLEEILKLGVAINTSSSWTSGPVLRIDFPYDLKLSVAGELEMLFLKICGPKNALEKCKKSDLLCEGWKPRDLLPREFRELFPESEKEGGAK